MSKRHYLSVLIFLSLTANASLEFKKPIVTENWLVPLRWNDQTRYHFGPQEFFKLAAWPQNPICVFVGSHKGALTCLDVTYGFARWSAQLGVPLVGNVAIYDGFGYVMGQNGTLFKIGLSTGNVFWEERLGVGVIADIWVDKGGVYFLTASSELWKYNLSTREVVWKYQDEIFQKFSFMGASQPVRSHDGKKMIIGVPNGGVVAVDDSRGTVAWEHVLPTDQAIDDVDATPVLLPDGTVIVSTVQSSTHVLRSADGKLVHAWPFGSPRGGIVVKVSGRPHYLQPSIGAIRLIEIATRHVIQQADVPITWGYPLRPVALSKQLYLITFSFGPAIVLNADNLKFETVYNSMTGFSAQPLSLRQGELILYTNFANVVKLVVDVDRLQEQLL